MKIAAEKECHLVEELRVFVTERQSCTRDEECVVVHSDCPFGCEGIPVMASEAVTVERKQEELRRRYNDYCRYKCDPVWRAVCRNGWCVATR
jgi:hypothetical protein